MTGGRGRTITRGNGDNGVTKQRSRSTQGRGGRMARASRGWAEQRARKRTPFRNCGALVFLLSARPNASRWPASIRPPLRSRRDPLSDAIGEQMGNIGIPDIEFALFAIGVPMWAYRGFRLPKSRTIKSALVAILVLYSAVRLYNWAIPLHAITV